MNQMNFLGVGPKIGRLLLPWLGVTLVVSSFSSRFAFETKTNPVLFDLGIALLILGLVLYFSTVRILLKGLKEGRLVTNWTFYFCQNPLYVVIISLIFPAISLLLNSWLILTSCLLGYILLKIYIVNEYLTLENYFGEEYLKYKSETPEFFPLPIKKWINRVNGYSK
jgi:protein-S-isoprenylcysteine O-methyltransferase Ste14